MVKWLTRLFGVSLALLMCAVAAVVGMYFYVQSELPNVETLKTVQWQTPMRIYSADGELISQFGEKRRIPLTFEQIPEQMIQAILATEDSRFYQHPGVDVIGVARAALSLLMTGEKHQGASTITMQVARNFFLSREKTYIRKIKEIFIAWHIEQLLSKNEILELYLNRIPLGHRAYGIGAAAQVYYGKEIGELTLPQIAVIAGLPKAPSVLNPITSPERARARRAVVLGRMLEMGYITQAEYDQANAAPISASYHGAEITLHAPYLAEMVRQFMVDRYGEDAAYTEGYAVYTTVTAKAQQAANEAVVSNLLDYDQRHGFRGPVTELWAADEAPWDEPKIRQYLADQSDYRPLQLAVITTVEGRRAEAQLEDGPITLEWDGLKWARRYLSDERQGAAPDTAAEILAPGQVVWVRQRKGNWQLSQLPDVEGALISLSPSDGAVQALVGGFNYHRSKFNRVTQARRQLGSNIKPFIYSAALDNGYTLASLINDAPINSWDPSMGIAWRPKNSPPVYNGPTRLRVGLAQSKNVMSVRLLQAMGLDTVVGQLTKFGFTPDELPHNESLALGSASVTPLEVARAFTVFANGGFLVEPYWIDRIENSRGEILYQAQPQIACVDCDELWQTLPDGADSYLQQTGSPLASCPVAPVAPQQLAPRVISEQNTFLVTQAMTSVIWGGGDWSNGTGWSGTGWRAARELKRHDIAGKTGTTNEAKDAWFSGFSPDIQATSWIGFDDHRRDLGRTHYNNNLAKDQITGAEAGAKSAQPAWIRFMQPILSKVPERSWHQPEGVISVRIDRETGLLTKETDGSALFEYFIEGSEPTRYVQEHAGIGGLGNDAAAEELF